jgi:hypothetical protein
MYGTNVDNALFHGKELTMPENSSNRSNSIKNPEVYDALREDGASEEKAARISNAITRDGAQAVGSRGGHAGSYEDWTVPQLQQRAKDLGLEGYSGLNKKDLITLLRNR